MTSNEGGVGSVQSSDDTKRRCARDSLAHNVRTSKEFCKLFPELVERHGAAVAAAAEAAAGEAAAAGGGGGGSGGGAAGGGGGGGGAQGAPAPPASGSSATAYLVGISLALLALFAAVRFFGGSGEDYSEDF